MMLLRSTSSIVLALSPSDQYNILMLLKIIGIGICLIGGFSKKAKNKLRSLLLAGLAVLVLFLFHFNEPNLDIDIFAQMFITAFLLFLEETLYEQYQFKRAKDNPAIHSCKGGLTDD